MPNPICAAQGLRALVLAVLGATAAPAFAADATFTVQGDFAAATAGAAAESFESLAGTTRGLASIATPLFTVTTAGASMGVQTGANAPNDGFGAFATDGSQYVSVYQPNVATGSITFTLSRPATAFGLSLTDVGEVAGTVMLTTDAGAYAGGVSPLSFPPTTGSGGTHFVGLTQGTPFSVVTLTITGIDEAYGLDAVRVLSAVPEPASALLLLAGIAGLVALRRRC